MKSTKPATLAMVAVLLFAGIACAQPSSGDRVAALKANMAQSKAVLHHYQWTETTVISVNGEEKSSVQKLCYYDSDGDLQKVEVGDTQDSHPTGGPFRRIIAKKKKAEMSDYMKSAVSLVKTYVPPNPARIQAAKDAGNVSMEPLDHGARVRLTFHNYEKPGDTYSVILNPADNHLTGLKVDTYLDDPSDAVTLSVTMGQLGNGTTYTSYTTLNAKAKGLTVTVHNSGYRKIN